MTIIKYEKNAAGDDIPVDDLVYHSKPKQPLTTNNIFYKDCCDKLMEDVKKSHNEQTLTEQWKKGELEEGWYYANNDGERIIIYIHEKNGSVLGDDFDLKATDWIKPIAPVPSYKGWQQMKAFCEEFNTLEVSEENQKLKEMLKEWMHFYPIILYEHEDTLKTKDIVELYDKTREALK